MNVEKEWLETLKILILYKFADKGTAESTADEIYRVFLRSQETKEPTTQVVSKNPDTNIHTEIKGLMEKDYGK